MHGSRMRLFNVTYEIKPNRYVAWQSCASTDFTQQFLLLMVKSLACEARLPFASGLGMRLLCLHWLFFFPGTDWLQLVGWVPAALSGYCGLSLVASPSSMEVGVITSPSPSPLRSLALVISLGGNSSAYYALPTLRFLGLLVERLEAR